MKIILFFLSISVFFSQNLKNEKTFISNKPQLYILPLDSVKCEYINSVKISIESFYGIKCVVLPKTTVSSDILSKTKKRLDAKKILKKYNIHNKHLIVLTQKDISLDEYGIFGLGYRPGKISVISTFRFSKNVKKKIVYERLSKITLHELGHNFGLRHCENIRNFCFMKSAKHTIKTIDKENLVLCNECQKKIKLN